jgi:hypothetical protein
MSGNQAPALAKAAQDRPRRVEDVNGFNYEI